MTRPILRQSAQRTRRARPVETGDRAQAFTLEAFVASLLLVTALVVALGSTSVTPLSASGSGTQIETQQAAIARGTLDSAAANGSLHLAVLFWDDTAGAFHGASTEGDYPTGGPPNEFGVLLDRSFGDRDIAFNVDVRYVGFDATGEPKVEAIRMVNMGEPSDTGVRVVEWLTLYDDDTLYASDGSATSVTLASSTTFYAPDADTSGPVYNVVQVEVVVWRV